MHYRRRASSGQCLLALGCVLVILFPVISATDDLHVVLAAMEESPISKQSARSTVSHKQSFPRSEAQPALSATSSLLPTHDEAWRQFTSPLLILQAAPVLRRTGRAPPSIV